MDHESLWDQRLRIQTGGRDEVNADAWHHPYEPTPYAVLERLAASGLIGPQDTVLDYGCGKGRVGFFLSHQTKAKTVGIEYDARIYESAIQNKRAAGNTKAEFRLAKAEEYSVPAEVTRYYFFNPFSAEILQKVLSRVLASYYESPREIFLFFYYPADEYVSALMAVEELEFYDEIQCGDLFPGSDPREQILIFRLPDYP